MPNGVETFVDGGFATVDFVNPALRGPALAKLIEIGGPESIQTITRDGPRRKYTVPEGNAREAGLIDGPADVAHPRGDLKYAKALADADPIADGGEFRPDVPTVKGANDAGPVKQTAVLGNQSVSTTESAYATTTEPAVAPPHVAVIAKIQADRNRANSALAKRRVELAPDNVVPISGPPTIAAQKGALATDPQSRPSLSPDRDVVASGAHRSYPDGAPSKAWNRAQIDAHAADVHGIDTTAAPTKQEALDQIGPKS